MCMDKVSIYIAPLPKALSEQFNVLLRTCSQCTPLQLQGVRGRSGLKYLFYVAQTT